MLIRSTGSADKRSLVNAERACAAVRGLRQPWEAILSHCDSASVNGTPTSAASFVVRGRVRGELAGQGAGHLPVFEPITRVLRAELRIAAETFRRPRRAAAELIGPVGAAAADDEIQPVTGRVFLYLLGRRFGEEFFALADGEAHVTEITAAALMRSKGF